ncbi:uncharacterized protein LOC128254616 [Drosophila gunungcola]|uniref:Cytochrome P450 4p1 n=1 Tax=Drosophila gunungcola TaxID=103775 RepID=A0A9P9YK41_9MUSC|nr:uncharacterized protein LOC128254616 [Drosophila gunungcola]KAI8038469.1 hypothetical protein M5D96_008367 [Drosophila gunungcola]
MIVLWLIVALSVLLHWLHRVNKDYNILSFFAKRVRTKDGTPVESIAPIPKGRTIFANTFDLYGRDHAGVFQHSRDRAAKMGISYLEYGVGTSIYNIIDADNAENVLNHPNLITKGLVYNFLHPFLRTGLLTSTGKKWHARRKMLTPTFHFNILNQFQEIFKTESQKFLQQFKGQDEVTISLQDVIPRFTLNSICETAMGVKLDEMAEKGDRYRENFSQIEECFIRRLSNPLLWGDSLFNMFAAKDYASALDVVHGFSSEIIAKRRVLLEGELDNKRTTQTADDDVFITKKRFAMLDTLICAEKDGLIDHIGICEEVDTLMFEGYDTTSIGLIFGLMNMSLNPDKQELCFQEIQENIEDDLSNLDVGQLNKLKYLEYFMKETMRLYPSVPIMGRQATQETELANGLILPKGSQITIHVFDIHRNAKYWDSPEEFRPERFLPENSQNRHTYAYIPFSAGQRNCIGQKYAMQEMKTLMVVLLKQFKILPAIDPKDIVFNTGITLRTQNKIHVKLVRRKKVYLSREVCGCCCLKMIVLLLVGALSGLLYWLYRINNDYCVLAFFARRIRTKDGQHVESIAPLAKGTTVFANNFDLYGKDHAGVFNHSRDCAKKMGESYIEYGMGTSIYNIIDADNAENVLNDPNMINKGLVYNFLHPFLRTGLLTSTGKKWHARRKMLTPTFHFNILNQFQEVFKTESIKFLQQFKGQDEVIISLNDVIPRFTLNSICETAMGVKLDEMAEKGDRYRENFKQIEECFIRRLSNPLLWSDSLFNIFAAKDYASALNVVHSFSSEIIAKRRVLLKDELDNRGSTQAADDDEFITKKRFAMLDTLICAEKDGLIDHIGICEEVDTLMFEGYDTTSIGLIFGLMNMSHNTDKQEICFQEIQENIDDELSNLDISHLNKLKYLEYFIKETMRLFPSVPDMGRETSRDTELDNGLILPKSSQIVVHVFDIHRNPKYWDSPEEFRPERFLPENAQNRHTYAYIPFSAGQRNCIGQKYAMQEMKTLMVVLLKHFQVLPIIDPKEIVFETGITLRTKNKIHVKLVRKK